MGSAIRPTTITVPTSVRRALERYKNRGQSYADVILEFMEEFPPEDFLAEMERRLRDERRYPMSKVLRDAGL